MIAAGRMAAHGQLLAAMRPAAIARPGSGNAESESISLTPECRHKNWAF
jgi:hypothetical protein